MIDRTHALPITRQAAALGISRGAVYHTPRPTSVFDLALMRRIDAVRLEMPWFGARGLRRVLKHEFPGIGRRRFGTLMRTMGISAIAPQPGASRRHRAHPVFPYLLRQRLITRLSEVWAMDITYIPMARGFVYLAAVMDWASRRVLSWRFSITLDSVFCVAAVERATTKTNKAGCCFAAYCRCSGVLALPELLGRQRPGTNLPLEQRKAARRHLGALFRTPRSSPAPIPYPRRQLRPLLGVENRLRLT